MPEAPLPPTGAPATSLTVWSPMWTIPVCRPAAIARPRAACADARSTSAGEAAPIWDSVSPVAGSVTSNVFEASTQLPFHTLPRA